jgi:outer membrane protein assembly factor BamE (lipoprotein component of BamABCDE complex)
MKRFLSFVKKRVITSAKCLLSFAKKTIIVVWCFYVLFYWIESFCSTQVRQNFHLLKEGMTEEQVAALVGWPTFGTGYGRAWDPDYLGVWYLSQQPGTPTRYVCIFGPYRRLVKTEKGNPEINAMEYEEIIEKLKILIDD